VEQGVLDTTKPPQQYRIYLPPCYDEQADLRYPVLYLLHGQTYTDDQWLRMGADRIADRLIHLGEASPFIIVFPDDRYWNLASGPGFGDRLIGSLIPYIDATYRTMSDREHRALGGLSRGGGWAVRLGLTHPEMFGVLGLHSPAVFKDDNPHVASWIKAIPAASFPRLWLDVGDRDGELGAVRLLEGMLSQSAVVHEFHLYSGDHSEVYWRQHVEEYLQWYVSAWAQE
jgi:enterochelin esterase-like enzyme